MKQDSWRFACSVLFLLPLFQEEEKKSPETEDRLPSFLSNGGFEEEVGGMVGDHRTLKFDSNNWSGIFPAVPNIQCKIDSSQRSEGKRSFLMQNRDGGFRDPLILSQSVPRDRFAKWIGKEISFTAMVKTLSAAAFDLRAEGFDAKGKSVASQSLAGGGIRGTQDWKKVESTLFVPANVSTLTIHCVLQGPGSVWIDDVYLGPVPLEKSKSAAPKIQEFRQKLSQYLRAAEGKESKKAREALDGYRDMSIEALIATLQKGFAYEPFSGKAAQALQSKVGGKVVKSIVTVPQGYDPEKLYPVLVDLNEIAQETIEPWVDQAGAKEFFVLHPLVADADHTFEALRELRRKFSVDPNRSILTGSGEKAAKAMALALAHPGEFCGVIAVQPVSLPADFYFENASLCPVYLIANSTEKDRLAEKTNAMVQKGASLTIQEFESYKNPYASAGPDALSWAQKLKRDALPNQFRELLISSGSEYGSYSLRVPAGRDPAETPLGRIDAQIEDNRVLLVSEGIKKLRLLIDPRQFDVDKAISVQRGEQILFQGNAVPDFDFFLDDLKRRADFRRIAVASLDINL